MKFVISKAKIDSKELNIVVDKEALSGVKKVANLVSKDIEMVVGSLPDILEASNDDVEAELSGNIVVATCGHSSILDKLIIDGIISIDSIKDKRETYIFKVLDNKLLIVGSDKRGTIYGLFHLSELLGVSPLVNWMNIKPVAQELVEINNDSDVISKEPSVRYRGFFINDEWPAFGNWCEKRFGGFNAKCYENVFELLLRLKGNYLWPAMWSAIFSNDGPGMDSAILADELGVVMGMSHHEPCLRNGEEYRYLRGKDSIYGDAWNFRTNEQGITRFWEDGLKRNGHLENVITVGMRGEADSTIMGEDATLKDNIDLLRDVLKCQNRLIRENVNANLDEVPRMLALYKEVEPFFYGDETTPGLIGSPELEGVTLMLCDDNFGNLRTAPTPSMREHKGGYGMYYHFDYHGWPISYEWVNSSYLPKVWEQMTEAYEYGIRDLWIVNVGDIFSTEYPLAFFLDLAYDYDKWGISNIDASRAYTKEFVAKNFGQKLADNQLKDIEDLLMTYTKIAATRRPEAVNDKVYSVVNDEAYIHMELCKTQMDKCAEFYNSLDGEIKDIFFVLVYYPMMANLNIHYMWCATTINHYLAEIGAVEAIKYAHKIENALLLDKCLVEDLHTVDDGRWYGMGLSEHIGFKHWNEEECRKPIMHAVIPANKPRIIVSLSETKDYTEGGDWTKRTLKVPVYANEERCLRLYSASKLDSEFDVVCENASASVTEGILKDGESLVLKIKLLPEATKGCLHINTKAGGHTLVEIFEVSNPLDRAGRIVIPASEYARSTARDEHEFNVLPEFGIYDSAIKVMPYAEAFECGKGPSVDYEITVPEDGEYVIEYHVSPSNSIYNDGGLAFAVSVNSGDYKRIDTLPTAFKIGDRQDLWQKGVLDNIRIIKDKAHLVAGTNTISVSAISPRFVLQQMVIAR